MKTTALFFLFCLTSYWSFAQAGQVDMSFNPSDYGYNSGISANNTIESIALTPNNKLVMGGQFTSYNAYSYNRLVCTDLNGVIDLAFNIGVGFNNPVKKVKVQPDGKIICSGTFTLFNGTSRNKLARLNPDGSLDNSFNFGTGSDLTVQGFSIQDDGKILVFGNFTSFSGQAVHRIVRLNSDGSLDSGFNIANGVDNNYISSAIQLSSGKIAIAGNFNSFNGTTTSGLVCLNSDGTLDSNFASNMGTALNGVNALAETTDGKIIAVGTFSSVPNAPYEKITKFNPDGTVDASFNTGSSFDSFCYEVLVDDQNRIIVSGSFDLYNGNDASRIARLLNDGSLDSGFISNSNLTGVDFPLSPIFVEEDKIMVCGVFTTYANEPEKYVVRLNTNGTLDTGFNPKTAFNSGIVRAVKQLSDGRIVIGGLFDNYFGETVYGLIMTDANGNRDMSFNIGTGILPITGSVYCIEQGAFDNIIIGGSFTSVDGLALSNLAVISTDGIVDNTIDPNPNGTVFSILIASNNDMIVGGSFTNIDDTPNENIVRLNQYGQLVNWNSNGYLDGAVYDMAWLADGSLIAVGAFEHFGNTVRNRIVHIGVGGSITSNFNNDGFIGSLFAVAVQPNGSIIVGGTVGSYDGDLINYLIRFDNSFQVDPTFDIGTGPDGDIGTIKDIIIDSGNKIVLAGSFTIYDNQTAGHIARLNNDGSLDLTFDTGTGADHDIESVIQLTDGRYLFGGSFKSFNGIGRNRIAAVNSCEASSSSESAVACDTYTFNGQEYTLSGSYTQLLTNTMGCDSLVTLDLEILNSSFDLEEASSCGPYNFNNVQYDNSGVYTQVYANEVGCDSIVTLDLTVFNLNLNVTQNGNTLTASEGGATYQWIDCTNGSINIPNATNQSYTPTINGSYAVFVTENGCTDVSECIDVTLIGIEEQQLSGNAIHFFPMPVSNELNITIDHYTGPLEFVIYNALGEKLMADQAHTTKIIDLSHLSPGVYTTKVRTPFGMYTDQLIKVN